MCESNQTSVDQVRESVRRRLGPDATPEEINEAVGRVLDFIFG